MNCNAVTERIMYELDFILYIEQKMYLLAKFKLKYLTILLEL